MAKKIGLIGSAPSSIRLAPYKDLSWTLWGCSPGAYPIVERADAWFELHRWEPPVIGDPQHQVPWFTPEYCQWLGQFPGPVYVADQIPNIPRATLYPCEQMIEKYGPYFFTSSLSWMFALALEDPEIEEIGLWGVDMSATEEWGYQRAGCHYFVTLAMQRGIAVIIPPESDLLCPKPLYGIGEGTPMMVKHTARMRELQSRLNAVSAAKVNAEHEEMFLRGAIDNLNYEIHTWTAMEHIERFQRAHEYRAKPGACNVLEFQKAGDD